MSSTKVKLAGLAIAGALSAYFCTPAAADLDPAHKGGTMRLLAVGAGGRGAGVRCRPRPQMGTGHRQNRRRLQHALRRGRQRVMWLPIQIT